MNRRARLLIGAGRPGGGVRVMRRIALAVLAVPAVCALASCSGAPVSAPTSAPPSAPQSPSAPSPPPVASSLAAASTDFSASCQVGWSNPEAGPAAFMPADQETYSEAYAGGYTDYAVMTVVLNDGDSAVLGGFTVTLSIGGTTVTTFSLGSTTFPRTLPLFMSHGESENFYYDMAGDTGPGVVHINQTQFQEQSCSATAWQAG